MQRQRILFSAYRTDQYSDPDGYSTSLGLVLEQYPNDVIVFITDPRTGVQRRSKWPPTISEVVEACNDRMADIARIDRFNNFGRVNDVALLEAPREERLSMEELKAKHGPNWGLDPITPIASRSEKQAPSWEKVIADYKADPSRLAGLLKRDV